MGAARENQFWSRRAEALEMCPPTKGRSVGLAPRSGAARAAGWLMQSFAECRPVGSGCRDLVEASLSHLCRC